MSIDFKTEPFTLVLSGGGALGITHLGVLHDMELLGLAPCEIVGTSMGGIIGACKAIGMKELEIFERLKTLAGIFNWVKFSWSGNAVIDSGKIAEIFNAVFENRTMSDTQIPLKLIATNLVSGNKKVFDATDDIYIKDAVLATMAIPGIFAEQEIDGEIYGDGFLCENLGLNEASYENILAVDVLGQHSFEKKMPDGFFKTTKVLEMFEKSMRLLIYNQTRTNISHSHKNILLLEPDTRAYKTFHFNKTEELRALGLGLLESSARQS